MLNAINSEQEIVQLQQQIQQLQRELDDQSFLITMTNLLIAGHDLEDTIKTALQLAMDITGSEAGCIYITDGGINKLQQVEVNGNISAELVEAFSKLNQILSHNQLRKILEINQKDSLFKYYEALDNKLTSFINVPLIVGDSPIGYAVVMHRHEDDHDHSNHYSRSDVNHLQLFAQQAALLLDNTRLKIEQGKKETYLNTISSLISAIDAKDIYTQNHSQRVAKVTVEFSKHLGLAGEIVEKLQYGALLHDLGKIGIGDAVLNKPAGLSEEEFKAIKEHPVKGVKILEPIKPDSIILDIVNHHHERFDGNGYPDGLQGETIPFAARIVSIVDAWDAMNSDRAYRRKLSPSQILTEFERGKGTQFDPELTEEFVALLEKLAKGSWEL